MDGTQTAAGQEKACRRPEAGSQRPDKTATAGNGLDRYAVGYGVARANTVRPYGCLGIGVAWGGHAGPPLRTGVCHGGQAAP